MKRLGRGFVTGGDIELVSTTIGIRVGVNHVKPL
jgi:hypothetical protein